METWILVLVGFSLGTVLALLVFGICFLRNFIVQRQLHKRYFINWILHVAILLMIALSRSLLRQRKPSATQAPSFISPGHGHGHRQPSTSSEEWDASMQKRYFDCQVADYFDDASGVEVVRVSAERQAYKYTLDEMDDLNISIDTMKMTGTAGFGMTPRSSYTSADGNPDKG